MAATHSRLRLWPPRRHTRQPLGPQTRSHTLPTLTQLRSSHSLHHLHGTQHTFCAQTSRNKLPNVWAANSTLAGSRCPPCRSHLRRLHMAPRLPSLPVRCRSAASRPSLSAPPAIPLSAPFPAAHRHPHRPPRLLHPRRNYPPRNAPGRTTRLHQR